MKNILSAFLSLAILSGTAWAGQGTQLFKQFYYGMPKAEVMQAGAVSSSELAIFEPEFKNSLCMPDPVTFAGEEWIQFFMMDENGELNQISMIKDAEQDDFDTMLNVMAQSGFVGTYLIADETQIDFFSYHSQDRSDELNVKMFDALAAEPENITFCLVEGDALKTMKRKHLTSLASIVLNAPESMRSVDVVQGDGILALKFYLPAMDRIKGEQKAQQLYEDF